MKRPANFSHLHWDDPTWSLSQRLQDKLGYWLRRGMSSPTDAMHELTRLSNRKINPDKSAAILLAYITPRQDLCAIALDYLALRRVQFVEAFANLRSEDEAIAYYGSLEKGEVATYKTNLTYNSSQVIVSTIASLTKRYIKGEVNTSPQSNIALYKDDMMWVSPRAIDGALPSVDNPTAIWEIKEYWGKTKGGSKMSDSIYECRITGEQLRRFEEKGGNHVYHYLVLDGREQWTDRKSDLARSLDLLNFGLVDEIIIGREIETQWERILNSHSGQNAA